MAKILRYDDIISVRIPSLVNKKLERESIERQISKGTIIRELLEVKYK